MPKPFPTRYRTTNWSDYNAALRKRGSLSVWFDPEMVWHADRETAQIRNAMRVHPPKMPTDIA